MTTENQPEKGKEGCNGWHQTSFFYKKIQIPYLNRFKDIWEYKKAYVDRKIDFFSYLGPTCPICEGVGCYRMRKPYWRNAIEIYPYRKEKVPICRFECRSSGATFSLLPIQLIPYHQYTVAAVISMVVLAIFFQSHGKAGCEKSAGQADSESDATPFLVLCWVKMAAAGLRRAHRFLDRKYNLSQVRSGTGRAGLMAELTEYLKAIAKGGMVSRFRTVISSGGVFAKATGRFLFGQPSQQRIIDTV